MAVPSTPTPNNSTQCGYGIPSCSVNGAGGTYHWYLVSSGGTEIPGENLDHLVSYYVNSTTIFYVSESNVDGESGRCTVTATVTTPPSLTLTPTAQTINLGEYVQLSVVSPNDPNYDYTWAPFYDLFLDTGLTTAYSGQVTSIVYASPSVKTTFTLTATDVFGGCVHIATSIISVNIPKIKPVVSPKGTGTYKVKENESVSDVVMATYGNLSYIYQLILDNPIIKSINDNLNDYNNLIVYFTPVENKEPTNISSTPPVVKSETFNYKTRDGQTVYDICLQVYGSLDHIYSLIQDNSIGNIDSVIIPDTIIICRTSLIKDDLFISFLNRTKSEVVSGSI